MIKKECKNCSAYVKNKKYCLYLFRIIMGKKCPIPETKKNSKKYFR